MVRSTIFKISCVVFIVILAFVQLTGSGVVPGAYSLVLDEGIALTRRPTIDFIGAGVTCVDNAGAKRTDCTIPGGIASAYQTVEDEGIPLTQRSTVNFVGAGVTCVDAGVRTDCTITGGGAGVLPGIGGPNFAKTMAAAASLTITGAEHGFGHANLLVACYDNSSPPQFIVPSLVTIDAGTFNVVITFVPNATGYCVVNGGAGTGCTKFTITSANAGFIVANTTTDISLFTLPQYGKIQGTTAKHSVIFSDAGGPLTDVSVSVGKGTAPFNEYLSASSIGEATPVADTTFYDSVGFKSTTMAVAGGTVSSHFISTGGNFGNGAVTNLVSGTVDLWVCSLRIQ